MKLTHSTHSDNEARVDLGRAQRKILFWLTPSFLDAPYSRIPLTKTKTQLI